MIKQVPFCCFFSFCVLHYVVAEYCVRCYTASSSIAVCSRRRTGNAGSKATLFLRTRSAGVTCQTPSAILPQTGDERECHRVLRWHGEEEGDDRLAFRAPVRCERSRRHSLVNVQLRRENSRLRRWISAGHVRVLAAIKRDQPRATYHCSPGIAALRRRQLHSDSRFPTLPPTVYLFTSKTAPL